MPEYEKNLLNQLNLKRKSKVMAGDSRLAATVHLTNLDLSILIYAISQLSVSDLQAGNEAESCIYRRILELKCRLSDSLNKLRVDADIHKFKLVVR